MSYEELEAFSIIWMQEVQENGEDKWIIEGNIIICLLYSIPNLIMCEEDLMYCSISRCRLFTI